MVESGYSVPVNEDLFASALAELNFRVHQNNTSVTFHYSQWGADTEQDENGWWLSLAKEESDWKILLVENEHLVDVFSISFCDACISWTEKIELQNNVRNWLAQKGIRVAAPPSIYWAMTLGDTKNTYYPFALKNGVAGLGHNMLARKRIGQSFEVQNALDWLTFESYFKSRFEDEHRPTLSMRQSIAFLSRIRAGDCVIALKGATPIWVGHFTDHCTLSAQQSPRNQSDIQHVFRSVVWCPEMEGLSIRHLDEGTLQDMEEDLKKKSLQWLKQRFIFLNQAIFRGHGLLTQRGNGIFTTGYTHNDAQKTRYCDYLEQRAKVMDPTSFQLLRFLQSQSPLWMNCDSFSYTSTMALRETFLAQRPDIYEILLLDRTRSQSGRRHNIIWANDMTHDGVEYQARSELTIDLVQSNQINPRCLKDRRTQKERTKDNAEVFTPLWVVKAQNDQVDEQLNCLEAYVKKIWLEMTCGEGPYIVSRYDMETGDIIPIKARQGFLDRKLSRINQEVNDFCEWHRLVEWAFKSSYGFEWSGDSLFLARENLLGSYFDYFAEKWGMLPIHSLSLKIAEIISFNLFQMDGLTYNIPLLTDDYEPVQEQLSLDFDILDGESIEPENIKKSIPAMIQNWATNQMERFK